jgi:hypothetical protein
MEKYVPLALSIFLLLVFGFVEYSIVNASLETTTPVLTYGLEGFVFMLWSLGMFVIGATYQGFGRSEAERHVPATEKEEKSWSYF